MTDKEIYNKVYKVAKSAVLNNYLRIDFDDLVNDAYILTSDKKQELSAENICKNVSYLALSYKNNFTQANEIEINGLQTSFCRKCLEDKPIACFGVTVRKKTGKKTVQTYCHECLRIMMKKYRKRKTNRPHTFHEYADDTTPKEKQSIRHSIWQSKNRDRFNKYNNEWCKKQSQMLSDIYIKKLLRRHYTLDYINSHPKLILEKRLEVQYKRSK